MFGLILVVIGTFWLLNNLGILTTNDWNLIWPLILIALGLSIIFKRSNCCGERTRKHFGKQTEKEEDEKKE